MVDTQDIKSSYECGGWIPIVSEVFNSLVSVFGQGVEVCGQSLGLLVDVQTEGSILIV